MAERQEQVQKAVEETITTIQAQFDTLVAQLQEKHKSDFDTLKKEHLQQIQSLNSEMNDQKSLITKLVDFQTKCSTDIKQHFSEQIETNIKTLKTILALQEQKIKESIEKKPD